MKKQIITMFLATQILLGQMVFGQTNQPDRGFGTRSKDKRLALIIGNSDYQNTTPLPNPQNDATDMKIALESLGFEVIYGVNQNAKQMKALIRQFGDKLLQNKGVGLFYYAGHGVASGGENYLVPIDADIPAEDEIQDATVSLSFLLGKMATAENSLNLVILDACRNNPFARKWRTVRDTSTNGGLATITKAPTGTLIAYATAPGEVASDGTGKNGLYTQELLQQIKKPNLPIEEVFKNVRSEVRKKSKNAQVPWESSSIEGDFYFDKNSVGKPKINQTNSVQLPLPSADEVLNKFSNAIGYEKMPTTLVQKGTMQGESRGQKYTAAVEFYTKGQTKSLLLMNINGLIIKEIYDGQQGWISGKKATPNQIDFQIRQRAVLSGNISEIKSLYTSITVKGNESFEGKECLVVEAKTKENQTDTLFFDTDTNLLIGWNTYLSSVGVQAGLSVLTKFVVDEYVDISGYKLPLIIKQSSELGGGVTKIDLMQIKFNIPLDDKLFKP